MHDNQLLPSPVPWKLRQAGVVVQSCLLWLLKKIKCDFMLLIPLHIWRMGLNNDSHAFILFMGTREFCTILYKFMIFIPEVYEK